MGEPRDRHGIAPSTVAQMYKRWTGTWTFRYHDGKRYRYAKELVGHDLDWPTLFDAEKAARGFGIKHSVDVSDERQGAA